MAEFPPEDLGQEIDRLWAKVGASTSSYEPLSSPTAADSVTGSEVAWETMALLKRQHRGETAYWAELLEAKERAVRASAERLSFLELEVNRLREKVRFDETRFITDGVDLQAKAESAMKAVAEERAYHEKEMQALRQLMEQMRERMAAESAGLRAERANWEKKEHQYLLDLKELQALASRREDEKGEGTKQISGMSQSLKEAKNALEKTLSELLRERQVRAESEQERDKALKKVDEVQKHFDELSKIWEEERAQWRELWDRERSTWETQRGEFSAWEDKLRKERETWLSEVKAKEQDQARYTEAISQSLRESSEATTKMSSLMKMIASPDSRLRMPAWIWKTAVAVVMLCAAAYPVWRYASQLHFKVVSTRSVELANPTAAAYDGNFIWISEWDGTLLAFDPQSPGAPARRARVAPGGSYRPVSLAFGGGNLWSLDAAQARILRHKAEQPDKVVLSRASPGPAPTALAFDGESLWSFDAANKALYRHGQDEASTKAFSLDVDAVAVAMAWTSGQLWLADAKSHQLLVFDFKDERFKLRGRYDLSSAVIGLAPIPSAGESGRRLWVLTGPTPERTGNSLVQYAY